MSRTVEGAADLLAGLDSGAAALNNPRVVRDAQRADQDALEPPDWRGVLRRRLAIAAALLVLWSAGIVVRLVYLQVFQHDALVARAESQQSQTIELNPRRGPIVDRFGRVLAFSVDGDVVYAVPSDVGDPEAVASQLCSALDDCDGEERASLVQRLHSRRDKAPVIGGLSQAEVAVIAALRAPGLVVDRGRGGRSGTLSVVPKELGDPARIAASVCSVISRCSNDVRESIEKRLAGKKDFVYIRKRATPSEAQRIARLGLRGVGFMKESRRYYPNRDLASAILGSVDAKNTGAGGFELVHDKQISGTGGTLIVQHDAQRRVLTTSLKHAPSAGLGYELTIDSRLQFLAERELRAAIDEHGAIGGTVIMMEPHTGEILAMVSEPHFNPNDSSHVDRNSRVNRGVESIYEPGSTFKTITAAAALEEQVIRPTDMVDATMPCRFGTAKPISDVSPIGVVTYATVFAKSSNCGTARVAVGRLGAERLMRYVRRFGFGVRATRDFPAESSGMVHPPSALKEHDLARVAIGYTIAVTPLQMAAAMSAIANGGELPKPRLVRATFSGGVRTPTAPEMVRRAISPDTATRLTTMMETVVESGTARAAQIEGYSLAAKTGTARKLNPVGGGYLTEYMASTVGFFPSRNPAVAMIVVIDSPHKKGYYGGAVAAPVFQRIADATLRHLAISPNVQRQPPIVVRRQNEGPGLSTVADRHVGESSRAFPTSTLMPDMTGLSAREAAQRLVALGWEPRLRGQGFVASQSVAPGTAPDEGGVCRLELTRLPPAPAVSEGSTQ
ncbi:MAG: penicillin-binding protein [Luteitalea sp.]